MECATLPHSGQQGNPTAYAAVHPVQYHSATVYPLPALVLVEYVRRP